MVQCIVFSQKFCRVEGSDFVLLPFVPNNVPVHSCDDAITSGHVGSHARCEALWKAPSGTCCVNNLWL
jgi:hypothetical protein